jgi:hypothetical protein
MRTTELKRQKTKTALPLTGLLMKGVFPSWFSQVQIVYIEDRKFQRIMAVPFNREITAI